MKPSEEQLFEKYSGKLLEVRFIVFALEKQRILLGETVMILGFEPKGENTFFTILTKNGIKRDWFQSFLLSDYLSKHFKLV